MDTGSRMTIEINKSGYAIIELIDLNNKLIRTIHQGEIVAPSLRIETDTLGLSKGIYIFRLSLDGNIVQRKISIF